MVARIVYLALCTLVLAGIVHIAIVLMVPGYGGRDAARKLLAGTPVNQFVTKTFAGDRVLENGDPFFTVASCRYDLDRSALSVTGVPTELFWSLAVFNAQGRVVYSLNRKSAIGNRLNLVVVNPVQMARLRQFDPERLETAIVVETRDLQGFVIVRALERDREEGRALSQFMASLDCQAYQS